MSFMLNSTLGKSKKIPFSMFTRGSLVTAPKRSIIYFDDLDKFKMPEVTPINEDDLLLPGYNKFNDKVYGIHRDFIIPKVEGNIRLLGKKIRELQLRERYLPAGIKMIKGLRMRQADDTLEKLRENKEANVVVQKRDEWNEDLHLVAPWSLARYLMRTDNGHCRQYELDVGATDSIRVILDKVDFHPWSNFPIKIRFNRFVLGRPNPLNLPISTINHFDAADHKIGADLSVVLNNMDFWTYTDVYLPRIDLDCSNLTVRESIRIGDLERMLPDGMYLHKKYLHRKHQAIVKFEATKTYKARQTIQERKNKEYQEKKREIELAQSRKSKPKANKKPRKKFEKMA